MAKNPERRAELCDAALTVIARSGLRGLTHRAIDAEAKAPRGTASNYFPRRSDVLAASADRIYERLAPDPGVLARREAEPPTRELFVEYMRDIVTRVRAHPGLMIALFELRLEATRSPDLAARIEATLSAAYRFDTAYHAQSGLPGGEREVALLHWAIEGLLLDEITPSMGASVTADEAVALLVERLVPRTT
ncbi:MAG TPA: TetR/AcrR family transcriptional regulator [Microcella sp.]|nr:TetR/AcrR family transcriptional regulator [Microcella sp.]